MITYAEAQRIKCLASHMEVKQIAKETGNSTTTVREALKGSYDCQWSHYFN